MRCPTRKKGIGTLSRCRPPLLRRSLAALLSVGGQALPCRDARDDERATREGDRRHGPAGVVARLGQVALLAVPGDGDGLLRVGAGAAAVKSSASMMSPYVENELPERRPSTTSCTS